MARSRKNIQASMDKRWFINLRKESKMRKRKEYFDKAGRPIKRGGGKK